MCVVWAWEGLETFVLLTWAAPSFFPPAQPWVACRGSTLRGDAMRQQEEQGSSSTEPGWGVCCLGTFLLGEGGWLQAGCTCATPQPGGKSASLIMEAVQTWPYDTKWPRLPAWVQHTWSSGSELIPLCPVRALVRKQLEGNCRDFPKSERCGEQRESTRKRGAFSDAVSFTSFCTLIGSWLHFSYLSLW